jgi:hypothetical protein
MVAQQVLRIALATSVLVTGVAAAQGQAQAPSRPRAGPGATGIPVAIIDLGPGDRAAREARQAGLERELEKVQGVRLLADDVLRAALVGERIDPQAVAGRASLLAAGAAFVVPDCTTATRNASEAVLALAAAQAAGASVVSELIQAQVYLLLCADRAGDAAEAQRAAASLRALGSPEPPPGVSDAVWSRTPALDATGGVRQMQLDIASQPTGATVWIDHAAVGVAPLTLLLPEGEHLVAAARGGASVARRVTLSSFSTSLALALPPGRDPWRKVAAQVHGWRSGAARRTPAALGWVLARARVRYAVVIDEGGALAVWQRTARGARHIDNARDAVEIGALVADADRRRTSPGIDPDAPLLRESPAERAARQKTRGPTKQEWWVYAAVAGAVVVGSAIVLLNDLGDDHQRIEIRFP